MFMTTLHFPNLPLYPSLMGSNTELNFLVEGHEHFVVFWAQDAIWVEVHHNVARGLGVR